MARVTNSELQERIALLEAENNALRERAEVQPTLVMVDPSSIAPSPARKSRGWGWTLLAVVLILIGAILAPIAVVSTWAKAELTNTDSFVATFAPLADDPAIQSYVTSQTVAIIDQKVGFKQLASNVIDGITDLGTPPRATAALDALKGPAAQGLQTLTTNLVSRFVKSDAFSTIWTQALRISHRQMIATLTGSSKAAVTIGANNSIGIQIGPIITEVKAQLVSKGLTFASKIPVINKTIVVAHSDSLGIAQVAYGLATAAGVWLPWIALLFLAAGVVVARRRALALVWAAIALAVSMLLLSSGLGIGRILFISSLSSTTVPKNAAQDIYDQVVAGIHDSAISVTVLAVVVAIVAWLAGPFGVPRRLRGFASSGFAWVRHAAENHGISTGRVGEWLYAQRVLLRVLIALIAAVIVWFGRPLTAPLIIWTLVLAVVLIVILELLQRPDEAGTAEAAEIEREDRAQLEAKEAEESAANAVARSDVEVPAGSGSLDDVEHGEDASVGSDT